MSNFVGLVQVLRRLARESYYATQPTWVYTGRVTSASPLEITVDDRLVLSEEFFYVLRDVTDYETEIDFGPDEGHRSVRVCNGLRLGDTVALLREQGGQRFVVLDKMAGANARGPIEGGGGGRGCSGGGTGGSDGNGNDGGIGNSGGGIGNGGTATGSVSIITENRNTHDIPLITHNTPDARALLFEVIYDPQTLAVDDLCVTANDKILTVGDVPGTDIYITRFDPEQGVITFRHRGTRGILHSDIINIVRFVPVGSGNTSVSVGMSIEA